MQVEVRHGGVSGFGEAAPIARYEQSAASALEWLQGIELGDDPWALDEIADSLPPGEHAARAALDGALHDLQGKLAGVPVHKLLGLRREGPPTSWTVWLGDPGRHGATGRGCHAARVQAAQAEARRARRARPRARPGRSRGDRSPAPGRRQRVLELRRGARAAPADAARVLRAAAPGRRSRRARAEAPLARPRSTSTRTAARSPTSRSAPSARTASTSSSRSPAGSARPCGWRTPPARSGSG